jgi:hypothetical protein
VAVFFDKVTSIGGIKLGLFVFVVITFESTSCSSQTLALREELSIKSNAIGVKPCAKASRTSHDESNSSSFGLRCMGYNLPDNPLPCIADYL